MVSLYYIRRQQSRGRARADDRMVLKGILYALTTGCRWMDMPLEYGSYKTFPFMSVISKGINKDSKSLYANKI
jgi:transposase